MSKYHSSNFDLVSYIFFHPTHKNSDFFNTPFNFFLTKITPICLGEANRIRRDTGDFSSIFIVKMIKMVLTISVSPPLAAFKNLFCRSCIGLSL